ncbi:MAG: response regulator [Chloroflexia bacterium]|nr:response regulator [Chloroflexia bacterium]
MSLKWGPLFANILIVSAQADFVRRVRLVLQSAGYTVRSAQEGHSAWEQIQARPPALVLQDAALPTMDDYQLVRRIKSAPELPFIPILVASSREDERDIAPSLDAGADDFMYQSASNAELLTRVRALLRLKMLTDELSELNATLEEKVRARTRELEQAHQQLRHAEKLSAMGRLAATIVHEVNNPLNAILSLVGLIQEDCPEQCPVNPGLHRDLGLIEGQMHVIAKLVRQLRDFSRPTPKEKRPVALPALLQDVLALAGKEIGKHGIEVRSEIAPNLPTVLASPEEISEVLLNLLLNARDAMPEGGHLTVRALSSESPGLVEIRVSDTGSGIPSEIQERMFEPFFTTKGDRGTGLGLAVCDRIVQEHSGRILVDSMPGRGTTFTVQLPVAADFSSGSKAEEP